MSKYGKLSLVALTALLLAGSAFQARTAEPTAGSESPALTPPATPAAAAELRTVSVEHDASGRPVVTLSGSGPMAYETLELTNPQRLVVDLKGTVSHVDKSQVPIDDGGVLRVRAGQFRRSPEPVSRVVVDLDRPVPYHIEQAGNDLKIAFGAADGGEAVAKATPTAAKAEVAPVETKETEAVPTASAAPAATSGSRAVSQDAIEKLLAKPALRADEPPAGLSPAPTTSGNFETKTIIGDKANYSGKRISLNLVDTDIKQIFRLFHEISGLNFVLDPSVDGKVTIVLDNVPWDQAMDIILKNNGLDKQFENNVVRIAPTAKLASEAAARKQLKEAKDLEVEPITVTRTLSYAKADEVEKVIRDGGVLSTRGKVIVDKRTNALIISDIPKKVQPLDQLISTLDAETPQVMIEARIVETSKSFSQDLGIKWGFNAIADSSKGTGTGLQFPANASAKYGLNLPGAGTASTLAFSFGNILDSFTLDIALSDLETEGQARVLSSPKIATQNNERAEIEQGVRIPVVSTTATEINVEFVSASLRLAVTPQITADGTVAMDVIVENNTPDFVNRVGDVPPINTQRAQTKVLVADGGTAVIGGIFTVNEGKSEVGVPWFRKIPGLGWLFKTRNITNENRELLIFITPKIVKVG
ncbi:MAG TPA: type IV pilus secretin PilQ [Candidatus Polarisedimenticolaceae bacterium]|nr:type IV pilus secretin PilQ [Candidatus Polarisedimenticolaceae bacterium]